MSWDKLDKDELKEGMWKRKTKFQGNIRTGTTYYHCYRCGWTSKEYGLTTSTEYSDSGIWLCPKCGAAL